MKRFRHIRQAKVLRMAITASVLLIIPMVLAATLSCSSMEEGKSLFEAKCAECHPLDYAFREKKSLAEWNKITETMARYSNGDITDNEARIIAKYLANI